MKRIFAFLLVALVGFTVDISAQPPADQLVTLVATTVESSVCYARMSTAKDIQP